MKSLPHHSDLIEELWRRYDVESNSSRSVLRTLRTCWKTWAWAAVVYGTKMVKRAIDLCVAGVLLVGLSPLFCLAALAIKLTDGGSILFWQTRVGRWGREFAFPKFRSMVVNAEHLQSELAVHNDHKQSVTFKMKHDPRVTRVGRLLRRLSIDELPQLWCVLKGDMSLVGPRPSLPYEVAQYTLADRRRLDITPGLTCIWQVSGRSTIAFPQQVRLDVEYIESRSIRADIKILLRTIPAILSGKGAY